MTLAIGRTLEKRLRMKLDHAATVPANWGASTSSATPSSEDPFVEKRKEKRFETCEVVEVCILEMASLEMASERLHGILRDVSRSGLGLELSLPVNPGASLEIVLRNRAIIFGEVRYCRHQDRGYQVGVAIEDIYYPKSISSTAEHEGTVFSQGRIFRGPPGSHVKIDDVPAFLRRDLSETRTALVERHMASCEQCSSLMLRMMEDSAYARRCATIAATQKTV
jgi:hypothetical protein